MTKFLGTVHDNTDMKLSRLYSPLTMLFELEFLSPFAKTTLWEGKVHCIAKCFNNFEQGCGFPVFSFSPGLTPRGCRWDPGTLSLYQS